MNIRENEKICDINVASNIVSISWGQLEHFKCRNGNIKEISLKLIHKNKKIERNLDNFESRYIVLNNENEKQLSCSPWTVYITISMQFEKLNHTRLG